MCTIPCYSLTHYELCKLMTPSECTWATVCCGHQPCSASSHAAVDFLGQQLLQQQIRIVQCMNACCRKTFSQCPICNYTHSPRRVQVSTFIIHIAVYWFIWALNTDRRVAYETGQRTVTDWLIDSIRFIRVPTSKWEQKIEIRKKNSFAFLRSAQRCSFNCRSD